MEANEYEKFVAAELHGIFGGLRPDFWDEGACRTEDLDLFFPRHGRHQDQGKAIAICQTCPVRQECFFFGYEDVNGVWGGSSNPQRTEFRSRDLTPEEAWEELIELEDQQVTTE